MNNGATWQSLAKRAFGDHDVLSFLLAVYREILVAAFPDPPRAVRGALARGQRIAVARAFVIVRRAKAVRVVRLAASCHGADKVRACIHP